MWLFTASQSRILVRTIKELMKDQKPSGKVICDFILFLFMYFLMGDCCCCWLFCLFDIVFFLFMTCVKIWWILLMRYSALWLGIIFFCCFNLPVHLVCRGWGRTIPLSYLTNYIFKTWIYTYTYIHKSCVSMRIATSMTQYSPEPWKKPLPEIFVYKRVPRESKFGKKWPESGGILDYILS